MPLKLSVFHLGSIHGGETYLRQGKGVIHYYISLKLAFK